MSEVRISLLQRFKNIFIGKARNPLDQKVFHHLSLIAFFAWVGLGADGLSSSCYGPEEAFLALKMHPHLSIFVALASCLTVFLISASYSQIIELFPSGGGGYLVATKLLSRSMGLVSGCALLIDYVLTITISIAAGADAIFSFIPGAPFALKFGFAIFGVVLLSLLNIRGVKESVIPLVPVFLLFILTHVMVVIYTMFSQGSHLSLMIHHTVSDVHQTCSEIGLWGLVFLILRAYSMGAGTFTGIEAVSNGLPILRDPKVQTGKKTMRYMAVSLAFMVLGLMLAYLLMQLQPQVGKTLNAVLLGETTKNWGHFGSIFTLVALISEALLLFVAAQAGFLDGPRVLASMALDRWFPTRFSFLSDRLVTQNGILLMGGAALITMILTQGSVQFLVVLYSINVFITFCLSQAGMVRHWWEVRAKESSWRKKLFINGLGLSLTGLILASVVILKFHEGGWITLLVTGFLVSLAFLIKRHYLDAAKLLGRLEDLVQATVLEKSEEKNDTISADPKAKTAILLVNGFNGVGLHTLFGIVRHFGQEFRNFVFVEVGVIDAGNFKGTEEIGNLKVRTEGDINRYVTYMKNQGFYAEGVYTLGIDVVSEVEKIIPSILKRFPQAVFFGGQIVFPKDSLMTRWLHNYTVFSIQKRLYRQGIPFVIFPIRV
ncbi:MAG: APC family permease [Chlamydiae bacterium]|nr:APC family permease [Chlamydiota bacterium]MBI3266476.1 APC family permease [Chlamydiota bacterium]